MTERNEAQRIVAALHAARVGGDLESMLGLFATHCRFEIRGTGAGHPIAIEAGGARSLRPWLGMMVKVFRVSDYRRLSLVVESPHAVVHWRVNIHSKITGSTVATTLVDLLEFKDGLIASYTEYFFPC